MRALLRLATLLLIITPTLRAQAHPDWTTPLPPFLIAPNLYYVGSRDLASYLITTPAGDILINSNLASSPPQIRHSVEQLGFHFSDIKVLLISHAHSDHASGSAAILKQTHAKYMVMDADVSTIETGGRTDFAHFTPFPPAHVDRTLHDGSTVQLGGTTLTAHKTAGHTPGCTTWTLETAVIPGRAEQSYKAVIVGSPNVNPGYNLIDDPRYPTIAADFRRQFATLKSLPCDLFLGAHGGYYNMLEKYAQLKASSPTKPFLDPKGYQDYIADRQQAFEAELSRQEKARA